jgi:uncharacterized membrane protein YuzA (DUF378 family)
MKLINTFKNDPINTTALLLVYVGALNWLSIGLQNIDYVSRFAGEHAKMIFIAVGIAGVYLLAMFIKSQVMETFHNEEANENDEDIPVQIQY